MEVASKQTNTYQQNVRSASGRASSVKFPAALLDAGCVDRQLRITAEIRLPPASPEPRIAPHRHRICGSDH
jgi:hypothetical protein